jgi:hypothetical protein
MLHLTIPIALLIVFLGWPAYHLFIKKDFKPQLNNFSLGVFFFAVWGLIYFLLR